MKTAIAFLCLFAAPVAAHDWYPFACCSDQDCWSSPAGNITVTPEGYRIETSGEVIPFTDPRIRPTPPEGGGDFHVCHLAADPTARVLCLFVPEVGA